MQEFSPCSNSDRMNTVERHLENFVGVVADDALRSRRFIIIVSGIIVFTLTIFATIITDLITTGEIMKK